MQKRPLAPCTMCSSANSDLSLSCDGQCQLSSRWQTLIKHAPDIFLLSAGTFSNTMESTHPSCKQIPETLSSLIIPAGTPNYWETGASGKCSCFLSFRLAIWETNVDILSTSQYNLVESSECCTRKQLPQLHTVTLTFSTSLSLCTCSFTAASWIISNITCLHPGPCLRVCFPGNINQVW